MNQLINHIALQHQHPFEIPLARTYISYNNPGTSRQTDRQCRTSETRAPVATNRAIGRTIRASSVPSALVSFLLVSSFHGTGYTEYSLDGRHRRIFLIFLTSGLSSGLFST